MLGPSGLPVADQNLWSADASQKTEHTMEIVLENNNNKNFFP